MRTSFPRVLPVKIGFREVSVTFPVMAEGVMVTAVSTLMSPNGPFLKSNGCKTQFESEYLPSHWGGWFTWVRIKTSADWQKLMSGSSDSWKGVATSRGVFES